MVNQILAHVGNTPFDLIEYSRSKGMLVEAYSPVAHGAVLNNPELAAMAAKYGVSIAQLCIRYCLQLGLLPLPKTPIPSIMRSNAAVDFVISDADMETLKSARRSKTMARRACFRCSARSGRSRAAPQPRLDRRGRGVALACASSALQLQRSIPCPIPSASSARSPS